MGMNNRFIFAAMFVLNIAITSAGQAENKIRFAHLSLYQPEAILSERMPSVKVLAEFTRVIQESIEPSLRSSPNIGPLQYSIIVAIKPGGKIKTWAYAPDEAKAIVLSKTVTLDPTKPLPTVPAVSGLLLFGLNWSLNGGAISNTNPTPKEWQDQAKALGRTIEIGELVEILWPD